MKSALRILAASATLVVAGAVAAQGQPIPIVALLELSGAGASVGNNMKNGKQVVTTTLPPATQF